YDPSAGQYLSSTGGEVAGMMKVTAAGTPLSLDLTSVDGSVGIGQPDVNASRSIFDAKVNGETKFNILENGDATLSGKIAVGSLQTISDAEIGGSVGIGGDLAVGSLVRLDKDGRMKNIASVAVTSSVNPDGTVSLGNIPATSVGSAVSIAQTSADPVTATRAALALSTAGSSPLDYLVWSEQFQVTYDGRVMAKSLATKEGVNIAAHDLVQGTLVEGTVGDAFNGYLIYFGTASGKQLFVVSSTGQLAVDVVKVRALVLDNADSTRATIGSGVVPVGALSVTVSAPEVKPGMKVFLTPKVALTQSLAVTQVDAGSFTVSLAQGVTSEVAFDWWAVDVTNADANSQLSTNNSQQSTISSQQTTNSTPTAPAATESTSTTTETATGTATTPTDTTLAPSVVEGTTTTPTDTTTPAATDTSTTPTTDTSTSTTSTDSTASSTTPTDTSTPTATDPLAVAPATTP
ncbi:MAG: hypothetical protein HY974_04710, partial [Candidatus Kerfeldbacteria bacterium]|nr:hypothetical protein [Candidatus Kerfeldbacteria bacterium]